jgi:hypothetical protein
MSTDQRRELLDIIDWTTVLGSLSVLPCAYFWGCGAVFELFHVWCKGNTALVLLGVLLAVPLSAVAGTYGSRAWYVGTVVSVGTLLFFILRLH